MPTDHFLRNFTCFFLTITLLFLISPNTLHATTPLPSAYTQAVLDHNPTLYLSFNDTQSPLHIHTPHTLTAHAQGPVDFAQPGPRPQTPLHAYPLFTSQNNAAALNAAAYLPVNHTPQLNFNKDQAITLEAWVNLIHLLPNRKAYLFSKGSTHPTQPNLTFALYLTEKDGLAYLNFEFQTVDPKTSDTQTHRYTTYSGFAPNTGWHHISFTYNFGKASSATAYLDSAPIPGAWPKSHSTSRPPINNDQALFIGAASTNTALTVFPGLIDEPAIYRQALTAKQIAQHYQIKTPPTNPSGLPKNATRVRIMHGTPDAITWNFKRPPHILQYNQPNLAFTSIPNHYNAQSVIEDRTSTFLIQADTQLNLPAGKHTLLLRSLNGARLYLNDQPVATTPFLKKNANAHGEVDDVPPTQHPDTRPLPPGHHQQLATLHLPLTDAPHTLTLEAFVGTRLTRQEIGELSVSLQQPDGSFQILSPANQHHPLTNPGWLRLANTQHRDTQQRNATLRQHLNTQQAPYWNARHQRAAQYIASLPPIAAPTISNPSNIYNPIDEFINAKLDEHAITPAPLTDDLAFLRRLSLDTVGQIPTTSEIQTFLNDAPADRRQNAIDRFLANARWADHWTSYWQDVLAENPGILKPTLNNTGPFRWWIHESFLDNKPIDRFATELIMMQGSTYYGGPAGFEMASANDVPMAAKAHILGQAFLAIEMKCARCHDAPYHDVSQKDLFSMAAMLNRSPLKVPLSSSIPFTHEQLAKLVVELTLKPGESVAPNWPFQNILNTSAQTIHPDTLRDPSDPRDQLAAIITAPQNQRFAQVTANRIWRRLLGFALVEPVDDWQDATPSHPDLLNYLARELTANNYDLKHIARLIFSSHTYQRATVPQLSEPASKTIHLFASPPRRRLSAEQVVDSLATVLGAPLDSEALNMDVDATNGIDKFINLGQPTRAWHFTSLSNERDRPALSIPKAQNIIDILKTFGWRESRQSPLTTRNQTPAIQQPAIISNGAIPRHVTTLSQNNALTHLALNAHTPEQLTEQLFIHILSRRPNPAEAHTFYEALAPGFNTRIIPLDQRPAAQQQKTLHTVSWSNHLNPDATRIKQEMERQAREGPPPTNALQEEWRQRAEDAAWALLNTPEFIYTP